MTTPNTPKEFEQIRSYFASLIGDQEVFIRKVLSTLSSRLPEYDHPEQTKQELVRARKQLMRKKERYQDLYANDLITMGELKDKLSGITRELETIDAELSQLRPSEQTLSKAEQRAQAYRQEIERFLALETITNMDMRRILDHISVDRDGNVRVVLKKLVV